VIELTVIITSDTGFGSCNYNKRGEKMRREMSSFPHKSLNSFTHRWIQSGQFMSRVCLSGWIYFGHYHPCPYRWAVWDLENMTNHIFYTLTTKLIISIQYFEKYLVCSALTLCFDW